MSDFITNGASVLPPVKSDVRMPQGGVGEWAADDCNELRQAALDLRSNAILEATLRSSADAAIVASGATPANVGLAPILADGTTAYRTSNARWADVVNVKDFGAVGDGVADDTAALQAAINAGGRVFMPAGTYLIAGTLDIPTSNLWLVGAGRRQTFIKASTAVPVLRTTGFAALTGTGSVAGMNAVMFRDLTVDGNSIGTVGCQFYGWGYFMDNVDIYQCTGDGLYMEFGVQPGGFAGNGPNFPPECHITGVRTQNNGGHGVNFKGSNDSIFTNLVSRMNAGWGMVTSGTGGTTAHLVQCNMYQNITGGCDFQNGVAAWNLSVGAISPGSAPVIRLGALSQACILSDLYLVGTGSVGVEIQGGYHIISGNAYGCATGISLNGAIYCSINMTFAGGGATSIDFTGDGGQHHIIGTANSTPHVGTPATTDNINLVGGGSYAGLFQMADQNGLVYSSTDGKINVKQIAQITADAQFPFLGTLVAANAGADFIFGSTTTRTNGALMLWQNNAVNVATVNPKGGFQPGNPAGTWEQGAIYSGTGVPSNADGNSGDIYFRTDTPGTLAQRIYIKNGGSWVNALA